MSMDDPWTWPGSAQQPGTSFGPLRKGRIGDRYGVAQVLCVDPDNRDRFTVRYDCCGKEAFVTYSAVKKLRVDQPQLCVECYRSGKRAPATVPEWADDAPASPSPDLTMPGLPGVGVLIPGRGPGCGWWPVIAGPMGPRWKSHSLCGDRRESSV